MNVIEELVGVVAQLETIEDPCGVAADFGGDAVDAVWVLFDEVSKLLCLLDGAEVRSLGVFGEACDGGSVVGDRADDCGDGEEAEVFVGGEAAAACDEFKARSPGA